MRVRSSERVGGLAVGKNMEEREVERLWALGGVLALGLAGLGEVEEKRLGARVERERVWSVVNVFERTVVFV